MKKLIMILTLLSVLSCISLKDPSLVKILENVEHDIRVDSVKKFTHGFPFIRPVLIGSKDTIEYLNDKVKNEIIRKTYNKYGLNIYSLGCVISRQTFIFTKKYNNLTRPYLEKRNGKGWKEKMEKELNEIE